MRDEGRFPPLGTSPLRNPFRFLLVVLACVLCLSACGGDDGADATSSSDAPSSTVVAETDEAEVPVDDAPTVTTTTTTITATTEAPAPAADVAAAEGLLTDQLINVGGESRSYHLFVPPRAERTPLVVLLHENGLDPDRLLGLHGGAAPFSVWLEIAEREGFAVVAPKGEGGGWNDCRSDAPGNPSGDDVEFIRALIDEVATTYGVDPARVFATGMSNGGHMSIRLAEEAPDLIAGFAAVGAADSADSECESSQAAVPALFMNGTADVLMPFNGGAMANGAMVFSSEETVARWVGRNGAGEVAVEAMDDVAVDDGSTVTISRYAAGPGGAPVFFYAIDGGGHNEPSLAHERTDLRPPRLPQNRDIEMAEEVWQFFREIAS